MPNPVASEPAKRAPSCSPRCQPWENRTGDNLSPGGATSGQRQGRESTGDALTPPLRGWVICGLTVVPRLRRGLHDRARFAGWERWRRAVEIAMRYVPPFTFLVAPGFSPALPCCAQLCQCRLPNTGSAALPTESGQVPGGATSRNLRWGGAKDGYLFLMGSPAATGAGNPSDRWRSWNQGCRPRGILPELPGGRLSAPRLGQGCNGRSDY